VVGPRPLRRPRAELSREGVPRRPRRPARPGVPRAPLGRAVERRRRGARRGADAVPHRRAHAGRSAKGGRRARAARARGAAGAARRLVGVVGRRRGRSRAARHAHGDPGLPERHGPRLPPARSPIVAAALAQGGARAGGRGRRGGRRRLPRGYGRSRRSRRARG
jgi:hypothetical protein